MLLGKPDGVTRVQRESPCCREPREARASRAAKAAEVWDSEE